MKNLIFAAVMLVTASASAEDKMKMNFDNEDLPKIISEYSKLTGTKFVVDPAVRGKISIFIQEPITKEEAFNHLSTALMINGFAITTQNGVMVVRTARNAQRDLIDVVTELPPVAPAKMVTWIYSAKHVSVEEINRELRMLQSKDGELSVNPSTNQLMISDYTPNLHRVAAILKQIDKPIDPSVAKIIESSRRPGPRGGKMMNPPPPPPSEDGSDMAATPPPPQAPHFKAPPKKVK